MGVGGVVVAAAARTTLQNKRRNSKLPGTLNPTLKTPSLNSIVWRSEELIAVSFAVSAHSLLKYTPKPILTIQSPILSLMQESDLKKKARRETLLFENTYETL